MTMNQSSDYLTLSAEGDARWSTTRPAQAAAAMHVPLPELGTLPSPTEIGRDCATVDC
jgi:hypothetical protein